MGERAHTPGLTPTQREALEWLKAKRDAVPRDRWSYGFNPPNGRRSMVAAMRTSLANRGLVELQRISDRHIRYEITDAGRDALVGLARGCHPNTSSLHGESGR